MSSDAIQRAKPAGQISAAVATSQIFPDLQTPTQAAVLYTPGSLRLEKKRFRVTASGILTCATAAYTGLVSLYAALVVPATPLVPASWTLLGASGAVAIGINTAGFKINLDLLFDSLSGKLIGEVDSNVNNTYLAKAAIAAQLAAINGATEPVLVFAAAATFGTAAATNVGTLGDFTLDA